MQVACSRWGFPTKAPTSGSTRRPRPLVDVPTLGVIGTGKRVGKTAVTGHIARRLAATRRTVVVAMGRGGPPEPEVVVVRPTVESLLQLSREGRHAASDHLETAVVAGVTTVGCRRCGGGLAGAVAVSNVVEGVAVASGLGAELVLLDGSGAALPPVAADRLVLVASASQPVDVAAGYLNTYRARISDLVVVTMAEDGCSACDAGRGAPGARAAVGAAHPRRPAAAAARRRRRRARRVLLHGAPVDARPSRIAPRGGPRGTGRLRVRATSPTAPACGMTSTAVDADVFVVELKAAAVDVVIEEAPAAASAWSSPRPTWCRSPASSRSTTRSTGSPSRQSSAFPQVAR